MLKRLLVLVFLCLFGLTANAQIFGLTFNYGSANLSKDIINAGDAEIQYLKNTTNSLNARFYTRTRWAFRLGAEIDEIDYQFGSIVDSFQEASRTDLVALVGFEKHFMLAGFIDIYPGVVFPITFTGEEELAGEPLSQLSVQDVFASPGLVLGTNLKLLKILRLGLEADMTYDNFKADIIGAQAFNDIKVSDLDFNLYATIGIAF